MSGIDDLFGGGKSPLGGDMPSAEDMKKMFGEMMVAGLEMAHLTTKKMIESDYIGTIADYYQSLVEKLQEKGFTREEAIQIAISYGLKSPAK